jgi:hypothetical protein
MARIRVRRRVPVFSKAALDLADLCAREIWRGKTYSKEGFQESEEEVLLPTGSLSSIRTFSLHADSCAKLNFAEPTT